MHDFQLENFPYETPFGLKSIARSPMKVAFLDLDDRFLAVNDSMREIFWASSEVPEGTSICDLLGPSQRLVYSEAKRRLLEQGGRLPSFVDLAFESRSGLAHNFSMVLDVAFDPDHSPRYLKVLLRDAKERAQMLEVSRTEGFLRNIHAFIGAVDQDGIITQAEGLLMENVIDRGVGKHYTEVLEGMPEVQDRVRRAMSGHRFDFKVHRHGRWFHIWYEPTFNTAGKPSGAVWTAYSIDQDKIKERALLDELERQRELVRRREELLTVTSHEIRSPLATLSMQIQLLETRLSGEIQGSKLHEIIRMIATSGRKQLERVCDLAQRTLDVSRIDERGLSLEFRPCDLARVVRDVVLRCRERCGLSADRILVSAPETLTGNWDMLRLEQVVENLITNALKYGGSQPIQLRLEGGSKQAVLEVRDRGDGIDVETQKRIFDRFERGPSHKGIVGFGMGLYIVKQIVQGHGGIVEVRSAPGEGAVFRVEIPLSASAEPPRQLSN